METLFNPDKEGKPMRVACFMSGSGTNVLKLIEYQKDFEKRMEIPPFKIVAIFTDNANSNAKAMSKEHGIPHIENHFERFFENKGKGDSKLRKYFDRITYWMIKFYKAHLIALCGYSRIVTSPILDNYAVINVHPGDLSVSEDGIRKYTGLHHVPIKKAILSGEQLLHSTTHLVTEELDAGPLLLISKPLSVELPNGMSLEDLKKPENDDLLDEVAGKHQEKLKEVGDWEILPLTLHWIAEGRIITKDNAIYLDGSRIDNGYKL